MKPGLAKRGLARSPADSMAAALPPARFAAERDRGERAKGAGAQGKTIECFLQELQSTDRRVLNMRKVSGLANPADMLTKHLKKESFRLYAAKLYGCSPTDLEASLLYTPIPSRLHADIL